MPASDAPASAPRDETGARRGFVSNSGIGGALTLIVGAVVLYFARDIFVPLAMAALLSFVLSQPMLWLRHHGLGRAPAAIIVVAVAFIVILGFGSIVVGEVASLSKELPGYEPNLISKLQSVRETIPVGRLFQRGSQLVQELRNEVTPSPGALKPGDGDGNNQAPVPVEIQQQTGIFVLLEELVGPVLKPLATAGLVLVFVIFFLLDRENLRDRFIRLAGARDLHRATQMLSDAVERLSRYLWTEFVINAMYGLAMGIGLFVIGVPNAALWGAMFIVLRFVPYIGTWIAAIFPLALSIAIAPGWSALFETFGLFIAIELSASQAIEPWLFGASAGMSPVAVIVAATFWTWLWGPIGLVLSTPLTACLVVIGHYAPPLRFIAVLFGNEAPLAAEESFYQRLLAGDPAEASEQAESFLKTGSLAEFCDQVAVPALLMAQEDNDRGVLTRQNRTEIIAAISDMIETIAEDDKDDDDGAKHAVAVECLGARNELDDAAALLLAQLLVERGFAARAVPARHWLTEPGAGRPAAAVPIIFCLSHLGGVSSRRMRLLARRLRRRVPSGGRILLGFWSASSPLLDDGSDLPEPAETIATSLGEAVGRIVATAGAAPATGRETADLVAAADRSR
ncbi:MAG TPA: AI-2E family transporter [Stellaceae bacterium]|jgi:predicted PurR-regulated permease PerM